MVRHSLVAVLSFASIIAYGRPQQQVVRHPDTSKPLAVRWEWARAEAKNRNFDGGYWIGYSIQRLMEEKSFIGSYCSDERRNHPSLLEVITGKTPLNTGSPEDPSDDGSAVSGNMSVEDGGKSSHEKVTKEVGFLFHYAAGGADKTDRIKVSNLSLRVQFNGDPLIWLGVADDDESCARLRAEYAGARSDEIMKQLIMAIGVHQTSKGVFPFLHDVLGGTGSAEVRGDAAFWLGQLNTDEARIALVQSIGTERSDHVREQSIFALSEMEGEPALDALISFAQKGPDHAVRNKAIFWLGQKASEKAVETLRGIVYSEQETDLQKSALFALTQLPGNRGTVDIIKIARTHPNPKVRKEAIFWLSQSDDPRAIEVLVDIVKK